MFKKFIPLILALGLVAAACGGDDEGATTTAAPASVVDLAIEAGQFSTLVAAIEAAGLVETLEGAGPFTVLAPTNQAFEDAFEALGITADELLADTETLTQILTYHVLPQEADSQLIASLDGESVATVNGDTIDIAVIEGGTIQIDGVANVVSADLEAENGIVHVINAVLLPEAVAEALGADAAPETTTTTAAPETTTTTAAPETTTTTSPPETTEAPSAGTITDIVVESGAFPTLLAALEATGLDEVLAGDGPFTVFAPTEEAFAAALDALGLTPEELLADTETLTNILLYHVLNDEVTSEDIAAAGTEEITVETAQGSELVIVVGDAGNVTFRDQNAAVIEVDITASNGVIHVIDGVLLPPAQ
jgi:uncharacterized surface protein with fasciclin (FAS1) repeats